MINGNETRVATVRVLDLAPGDVVLNAVGTAMGIVARPPQIGSRVGVVLSTDGGLIGFDLSASGVMRIEIPRVPQ